MYYVLLPQFFQLAQSLPMMQCICLVLHSTLFIVILRCHFVAVAAVRSVLHVAAVSLPWTSRHGRAGSDGATSVHTLPYNGNTHYQNWTLVYRCLEP